MLLEGLHVPVTTPFYPDGRVYLRKLEHNVARYSLTPVAGLAILGPVSEAEMVNDVETQEILAAAIAAAAPEKVMWAGVGRPSVMATLDLTEEAWKLGYDVALMRVPQGRDINEELYFSAVADGTALPVAILDEAGLLTEDTIARLALHPKIIGIVSTADVSALSAAASTAPKREVTVTTVFTAVTGRMIRQNETGPATFVGIDKLSDGGAAVAVAPPRPALKTRTKSVGFQVLGMGAGNMADSLKAGAVGSMTPFLASAPQACFEVYAAWKDGDPRLSLEKQSRITKPSQGIVDEMGISGIKYAAELTGYYGGRPRLPRYQISAGEKAWVEDLMYGIRS